MPSEEGIERQSDCWTQKSWSPKEEVLLFLKTSKNLREFERKIQKNSVKTWIRKIQSFHVFEKWLQESNKKNKNFLWIQGIIVILFKRRKCRLFSIEPNSVNNSCQ